MYTSYVKGGVKGLQFVSIEILFTLMLMWSCCRLNIRSMFLGYSPSSLKGSSLHVALCTVHVLSATHNILLLDTLDLINQQLRS